MNFEITMLKSGIKYVLFVLVCTVILPVNAQDSVNTVVAEKGDGILSLLRKHGADPYETYEEFVSMNVHNLRDSVHLYEGRAYKIPKVVQNLNLKVEPEATSVAGVSYEIFGKKYAEVIPQSTLR